MTREGGDAVIVVILHALAIIHGGSVARATSARAIERGPRLFAEGRPQTLCRRSSRRSSPPRRGMEQSSRYRSSAGRARLRPIIN